MTIDTHVHLGRLADRDYPLEALRRYLDECRIDRAIVSNLDAAASPRGARDLDEPDANLACLEAAQQEPRLAALYWVRPGRFDSNVQAFAGALDCEPFVGALFAPAQNGFEADSPRLDPHLTVLARFQRPAFFLAGRDDAAAPTRVYAAARRFPKVVFVLCGSAPIAWNECLEAVQQSRQRQDARLLLATSHATLDDVRTAVATLGPEALLFGSGGPTPGAAQLLRRLPDALDDRSRERVLAANAQALLDRVDAPAIAAR